MRLQVADFALESQSSALTEQSQDHDRDRESNLRIGFQCTNVKPQSGCKATVWFHPRSVLWVQSSIRLFEKGGRERRSPELERGMSRGMPEGGGRDGEGNLGCGEMGKGEDKEK
eukprot:3933013-Rhodomonas_salina.1